MAKQKTAGNEPRNIKKVKDSDYFDMLHEMAVIGNRAALKLRDVSNCLENSKSVIDELHAIEHSADNIQHDLIDILSRAFITPIESEDILELGRSIDDVIDCMEEMGCRFYMYNIKTLHPDIAAFIALILQNSETLMLALQEFKTFKKSKKLRDYIIALKNGEEEGDVLYRRALHELYKNETDAISLIKLRDMFAVAEECCDAFEDVADILNTVVLKNS